MVIELLSVVDREHLKLHPKFRRAVVELLDKCHEKGWNFALFEGYRTPGRQQYLYDQGRSRSGPIVTKAQPWMSFHQYGLAADIVLKVDGHWSWSIENPLNRQWIGMRELAVKLGLDVLDWEIPHVQWNCEISDLVAGEYPLDFDKSWSDNITYNIQYWTGVPSAPPAPVTPEIRPSLPNAAELASVVDLVECGKGEWCRKNEGVEWRYDEYGVFTRKGDVEKGPWRSQGPMVTVPAIMGIYGEFILEASRKYKVCPQLILMTIATETGFARQHGFTGPATFRWESNVPVGDIGSVERGDYSAGPMQTLASTARWVIGKMKLCYDPFVVAPHYADNPAIPPLDNPLYDPKVNIDIGTAEIKIRWELTGCNPILVAAAYNAGGLYPSEMNEWHLRSYGDHLDRAAQWYGDACEFLKNWVVAVR